MRQSILMFPLFAIACGGGDTTTEACEDGSAPPCIDVSTGPTGDTAPPPVPSTPFDAWWLGGVVIEEGEYTLAWESNVYYDINTGAVLCDNYIEGDVSVNADCVDEAGTPCEFGWLLEQGSGVVVEGDYCDLLDGAYTTGDYAYGYMVAPDGYDIADYSYGTGFVSYLFSGSDVWAVVALGDWVAEGTTTDGTYQNGTLTYDWYSGEGSVTIPE
jgi:hypothetical protein